MDLVGKVIGVAIGLSVALSCLVSVITPAIYQAQQDDNLTDYAALIGIIVLVFIAGLVLYAWRVLGGKQ